MKPILYPTNETTFTTNGIGILNDAISCVVTQQRNGIYEATIKYPLFGGIHFEQIKMRSIILVLPDNMSDLQPMRVYNISKPMKGIVTINCRHIVYDLMGYVSSPFTATSIQEAFLKMKRKATPECPFEFFTDKTDAADFELAEPTAIWSLLGTSDNSLSAVYGEGEYEFDGFSVKLYQQRGHNRGVEIRYGKNLTDLTQDQNCEEVYTGIYPYWKGQKSVEGKKDADGNSETTQVDVVIELPEKVVNASGTYDFTRICPVDLSSEFEEAPSYAQLRSKANSYVAKNKIGVPKVSLQVSFISLAQTEEYRDLAILEQVGLCDIVSVYFERMNVTATAKVTEIKFDSIMERYESITIGDEKKTLANTVSIQAKSIAKKPSQTSMRTAITTLTSSIMGAKGGAVRLLDTNGDKYPDTLYIGDDPDPTVARKVWRFNYKGWAVSENGFNGPFTTGATLENGIDAGFVKTGTFDASLNKKGVLADSAGKNSWNMNSGNLSLKLGGTDNANGTLMLYNGSNAEYTTINKDGVIVTAEGLYFTRKTGTAHYARMGYIESGTYDGYITFGLKVCCDGDFVVKGTKSRIAETESYGNRLQYCYETPTPQFGDIGSGETDSTGTCVVTVDDIFYETVSQTLEYQVFLQKEGPGDIWISEKAPTYFVVSGTPNLKFSWELKAAQKGYDNLRLDDHDILEYEYYEPIDYEQEAANYMQELYSEMEAVA